jgi:hypothetical protein
LVFVGLTSPRPAGAFLEDLCTKNGKIQTCIRPFSACKEQKTVPNRACPAQVVDFARIPPGRSMIHADSTYFIALALGYRADVAYWIAAYNEVEDYAQYAPIDQCGGQATSTNSGSTYITASFNGYQRTNAATGGPLYHYVVNFSPNGAGTDVRAAGANAADLRAQLVGVIVSGQPWTRAEVYRSGVVTLPLQQVSPIDRLHAMNAALQAYSDALQAKPVAGARFTPFQQMPGNSASPTDKNVCFK